MQLSSIEGLIIEINDPEKELSFFPNISSVRLGWAKREFGLSGLTEREGKFHRFIED